MHGGIINITLIYLSIYRYLWREAHRTHVQPYAGPVEHTQVQAVDAVRQALQKLFCITFMSTDRVSPSLSPAREKEKENLFLSSSAAPKQNTDSLCPNVVPAECLLESGDVLYVVLPYTQYSLHDIVSYSPAKLSNSNAKVLFILYQMLIAMRACQAAGLSCGELSMMDIAVDEQLYSRLKVSLAHYEELGDHRDAADYITGKHVPRSNEVKDNAVLNSGVSEHLCRDCFDELKSMVLDWVHGRVSNFRYLMELNRLAGRREGDPNYHPVLPWVVDFTVPNGRFRDLRRSKFRLNKGDKQLDFTYEMTKEALAAAHGGSGGNFSGDLGVSVGAVGTGPSEHLHVPHHISDVLSDITYYVYKARQTPKSVLCSHVRSQWEPNEYPASMERIHSWTPDECIPEFFTDPSIFRSIHPDMPDLEVPPWCNSCEEFVDVHRRLLESHEVSQQLHHWIDLTFGYKLSGKEAVKAKNVCLHLVDNHTNLSCYGVVQLFDQPHPPRLATYQYSPPEPPYLGPATVPSWQVPSVTSVTEVVDGLVPEATGCETSGWTVVDRDDDLEQGMEALDSLGAPSGTPSSTTSSVPVPLVNPAVGKASLEHSTLAVSPSPSSLPAEGSGSITNALGSGIRSAMKGGTNKKHGESSHGAPNPEDFKITLPEGFSPLQPLEELEKLNNFLVKGLHAQVSDSLESGRQKAQMQAVPVSLADLFQRDMQALGVIIAEIFWSCKLRGVKSGSPLRQRFQAIMKLCSSSLRDVPLPLHHTLENLLHIHRHSKLDTVHSSSYPILFKYDPVSEGLPPPNPWQLLSPALSPLPFPTYFPSLHKFIFSYHSKMESPSSAQGRDIVFHLWQQLETLLQGNITAEGLEILLPFVLTLMMEESTAVYAAWYLFEPVAKVLGPRNATKYLLKPLISVYENPRCLRGRFYLYTDCFVLQLIVRLGLQAFLSSLLSHVLQVITGFEGCSGNSGSTWGGVKALRGVPGLGEDEEEYYECDNGTTSAVSAAGKSGGGSGAVSGGVGDPGLVDFSSGISLTDQVFLNEGEDFQNGFYVNTGTAGAPGEVGLVGKQQNSQNSASKDTDQESLSVGKLSDKSSASEISIGDGDSARDRASLKSADSNQDLKQASDGEDGGELDDYEDTVDGKESTVQRVPSLELTVSGCLDESGGTVGTLEGEFLNGVEQREAEKSMVAEEEEPDSSEESTEKEHKILLGQFLIFRV